MNRTLCLAFACLSCLLSLPAPSAWAADRPASQRAMAFLQMAAGPRAYGMGEAYSALADEISGLGWNPAGLGQVTDPEIYFMHNQWLANIRQEYLAFCHPLANGCAAVQAAYLNSDVQVRRDEDGLLLDNGFNPYSLLAGAGFGLHLGQGVYAGAAANYGREQLDDASYATGCLDAGCVVRPANAWWSVAAVVQNLGLPVAGYGLPLTVRAGAAARLLAESLNITVEIARTLPGWFRYSAGAEYWYQNLFALRAGYIFRPEWEGLDRLSGLRAGLGFNIQGYQLDYAFIPQGDLGYGHRASFTYFFGGGRALASEKQALIQQARQRGQESLRAGDYASATDHFQKVLTFVPIDSEARQGLDQARAGLRRAEKAQEIAGRMAKAEACRSRGQWEDAQEEYQRILLIDEGNSRAAQALAEGRKAYQAAAIAQQLENGRRAARQLAWADALLAFQSVLALDPQQAEARAGLEKARAELAKGGRDFKDPRIREYYLAGLKLFEQGDYRGAAEKWNQVLKLMPQHKEAKQYLDQALRLLEARIQEWLAAGSRYLQEKDLVRAASHWRRVLKLSPKHAEALRLLAANDLVCKQRAKELYLNGIENYTLGLFKQSIANWQDCLTLIPDYPGARDNIEKAEQKIKATQ